MTDSEENINDNLTTLSKAIVSKNIELRILSKLQSDYTSIKLKTVGYKSDNDTEKVTKVPNPYNLSETDCEHTRELIYASCNKQFKELFP